MRIMENVIRSKRVSISPTRQMTIPICFYKKYNFENCALLIDEGNKLYKVSGTSEQIVSFNSR